MRSTALFTAPVLALTPTLAWAAETSTTSTIPGSAEGALGAVSLALAAFQNKDWALGVGLVLAVIVFLLKRFKVLDGIKLGSKWGIRASTLILAVVASVAMGLQSSAGWGDIVVTAFEVAVGAVGGWEFVGKFIRDIARKSAEPEVKPPDAPAGEEAS